MIGLILSVWMMCVEDMSDADTVRAILREAQAPEDTRFAIDRPYDDAMLLRILHASVTVLGKTSEQLLEAFARRFIDDALQRWPVWFEMSPTARDFLERQPRIHARFSHSLGEDADDGAFDRNKFEVEAVEDGLRVVYRSRNRMCELYKALARELMAHYRDTEGRITESQCMHDGADACRMHVHWPRPAAAVQASAA